MSRSQTKSARKSGAIPSPSPESPPEEKEPVFIEGPVNFVYLVGDPGDGVKRKILLLGDLHYSNTPCVNREGVLDMVEFTRSVAVRLQPTIMDVFVESRYDPVTAEPVILPSSLKEGRYLNNFIYSFRECLVRDKSNCSEKMRLHYIDVRYLNTNPHSFSSIYILLQKLANEETSQLEQWLGVQWPSPANLTAAIQASLKDARLGAAKLASLHTLRAKFERAVLEPVVTELTKFYTDRFNKGSFDMIKKLAGSLIAEKRSLTRAELYYVFSFVSKFMVVQACFTDAYIVYRALKRATSRAPERATYALRPGEALTKIMAYLGNAHTFRVRDMLLAMGMKVEEALDSSELEASFQRERLSPAKVEQCLPYTALKSALRSFCEPN